MGNAAAAIKNGMTGEGGMTGGNMANPLPSVMSPWGKVFQNVTGKPLPPSSQFSRALENFNRNPVKTPSRFGNSVDANLSAPAVGGWNKGGAIAEGASPEGAGFISPMVGSAPPQMGMPGGGTNAPMAMAPGAMNQFTSPQMGGMPPGYTGRGNAQRRMPGQRPVKY